MTSPLPPPARAAIDAVARRASGVADSERSSLLDLLVAQRGAADLTVAAARLDELRRTIRTHATIALNFHPDRVARCGRTVARALRDDRRYRSQFETGHSAGSVSAFPGGDRDRWEEQLFDGAYHTHAGDDAIERPKYGALELVRHPDGPAPRFGSCALVLSPAVNARATFTVGDSHLGPTRVGTIDADLSLLAGVISEVVEGGAALGVRDLTLAEFLERLERELPAPRHDPAIASLSRNLDDYVEAQVHGPIDLARDASGFILDPSFRGTEVGDDLVEAATRAGCTVAWHRGSRVVAAEIPEEFRGAEARALACEVAASFGDGAGDYEAVAIGRSLARIREEREPTPDELQEHKYLWHALLALGRESC